MCEAFSSNSGSESIVGAPGQKIHLRKWHLELETSVARDVAEKKTKGGILVLSQCDQFRFEIGFSTSAEPAQILSLFFF